MVGTLSPILSQGVAPEQAVTAPSTGSAVAGLVGSFLSAVPTPQAAPKPTQGEQFETDWKAFTDAVGVQLSPSNPNYEANLRKYAPMFVRQHPQWSGEVSSMFKAQGTEIKTQEQLRQDKVEDNYATWAASPSGLFSHDQAIEAATVDGVLDQEKYNRTMTKSWTAELDMEENLRIASREAALAGSSRKVSDGLWDAYQPAAVQAAFGHTKVMAEAFQEVRLNGSAKVPEGFANYLGVDTITQENFVLVAAQYKEVAKQTIRAGLLAKDDVDKNVVQSPSQEYWDSVFVAFDQVIKAGEKDFGSIGAVLEYVQDQNNLEALRFMEEHSPNLLKQINLLNIVGDNLPVYLTQEIASDAGFGGQFAKLMMAVDAPLPETKEAYLNLSKKEQNSVSESSANMLAKGSLAEKPLENSFQMFELSIPPGSHLAVNSFMSVVGKNRANLSKQADMNPEFAEYLKTFLYDDLNISLNNLRNSSAESDVVEFFVGSDGNLDVRVDINAMRSIGGFTEETLLSAADDIKTTMKTTKEFKDINTKLLVIKDMGDTGRDVLDAMGNVYPEPTGAEFFDADAADPYAAYYTTDPFSENYSGGGTGGLIAKREGLRLTAYMDVDSWRTGYGSDTVTLADGTIKKVTKDTVITKEDAKRDLLRREREFAQSAARKVGKDVWMSLPYNVTEALTSITYNYGSLPDRLVGAVKSGNIEQIAQAVEGLAGDNKGVNRSRRMEEAAMIRGLVATSGNSPQAVASSVRPLDRAEFVEAPQTASFEQPTSTPGTLATAAVSPQGEPSQVSGRGSTEDAPQASKEQAQRVYTKLEKQTQSFLLRLFGSEEEILKAIAAGEISEADL